MDTLTRGLAYFYTICVFISLCFQYSSFLDILVHSAELKGESEGPLLFLS